MVRPYSTPQEWPYKKQTRIKHEILSGYLTRWMSILGRPQRGRRRVMHYVDGFAGSGRYAQDQPGSPVIAMEVGQILHDRYEDFFLECHFVESDPRTYEALRWNVEIAKYDFPDVWAQPYHGIVEDHIDKLITDIPEDEHALIFLDPFGFQSIDLPLRLLARRRNEIIVTFMSSFVNRFLTEARKETTMNWVFGSDAWQELVHLPARQKALVDFYGRQIQDLARQKMGLDEVLVYPIDVESEGRDSDFYHLIHLSRHEKARQAMEDAVRSAKVVKEPQLSLEFPDGVVEDFIIDELGRTGETKALLLAKKVCLVHPEATWHTDIRQSIRALELRGEVKITPYKKNKKRRVGSLVEEKDWISLRGGQIRLT